MPQIGEIKEAKDIDKKGYSKYIYHACVDCNKLRWVQFVKNKSRSSRCKSCTQRIKSKGKYGEKSHRWKGGRYKDGEGYIRTHLYPGDFFFPMIGTNKKYVLEHRLIMAKHLSRCLLPWEVVHHKNGIKDDNRIENLELLSLNSKHNTRLNQEIKRQDRLIQSLKKQIIELQKQIIQKEE